MPSKKPTAVGAYIFQGAQTLGVSKHFDVLAHFEDGPYGVKTCQANFPDLPIYTNVEEWPVDDFYGKVDFVYCNPPCAVFSHAGKSKGSRDGWRDDERLICYERSAQMIEKIRPKVLTIESVLNVYRNGRDFLIGLEEYAKDHGYSTTHLFVNALDCGLPQVRKRHFFIAHRVDLNISRPNKAHTTVKDVLQRINAPGWSRPVREDLRKYYPLVKANHGLRPLWEADNPPEKHEILKTGRIKGRPRMMEARLPWDKPMGAFIGDFYIHPTEDRNLGVNEAKALCGYPQDWKLGCSEAYAFSEFARAVLPPVADWLGEQIKNSLDNPLKNDVDYSHIDYIEKGSLL